MDMTDILKRIADRISEMNSSERAVAMKATGSADTIRNWRRKATANEDSGATLTKLVAVAKALHVSPEYLISGGKTETIAPGFSEAMATPWNSKTATDPTAKAITAISSAMKKPMVYQVNQDCAAFSICAGDLIIMETDPPHDDGLVVVTIADTSAFTAETAIRRKYGDLLLDPSDTSTPAITISDDQKTGILGTIKTVLRNG